MDKNEIITIENNNYIQEPGDKISQEMMPKGDIVTRIDTSRGKATQRQYMKKDGTPGKRIVTIMQPDE